MIPKIFMFPIFSLKNLPKNSSSILFGPKSPGPVPAILPSTIQSFETIAAPKEELLLQLCRKLRTKLVVSEERCRGLAASGAVDDPAELERLVQRRSEDPAKWPEELLYRESLTGWG